jgi:predicted transposase YbfD/YdcC
VHIGYNRLVFFLTFVIIHESSHCKNFYLRVDETDKYIQQCEDECREGKLSNMALRYIKKERRYQEPEPAGEEEKPEAGRYLEYLLLGGIIQFDYLTYDLCVKEEYGTLITIDSPFVKASLNNITKIKQLQTEELVKNNQKAIVSVKLNFKIKKRVLNTSKVKEKTELNQEYKILISTSITNDSSETIKLPPKHFSIQTASNLRLYKIINENNDRLRDEIAPHTHHKSRSIEYLGLVDVNPGKSIDYEEYDLGSIFFFEKDILYELDYIFNEYISIDFEITKVKSDRKTIFIDLRFQTFEQTASLLSVPLPINPRLKIFILKDKHVNISEYDEKPV